MVLFYLDKGVKFASLSRHIRLSCKCQVFPCFSLICAFSVVWAIPLEQDVPSSYFNGIFILMQVGVSLVNLFSFQKRFETGLWLL